MKREKRVTFVNTTVPAVGRRGTLKAWSCPLFNHRARRPVTNRLAAGTEIRPIGGQRCTDATKAELPSDEPMARLSVRGDTHEVAGEWLHGR